MRDWEEEGNVRRKMVDGRPNQGLVRKKYP